MAPLVKRYYVDEMVVFLSTFFPVFRVKYSTIKLSSHENNNASGKSIIGSKGKGVYNDRIPFLSKLAIK